VKPYKCSKKVYLEMLDRCCIFAKVLIISEKNPEEGPVGSRQYVY